jgi:hypothetical protein
LWPSSHKADSKTTSKSPYKNKRLIQFAIDKKKRFYLFRIKLALPIQGLKTLYILEQVNTNHSAILSLLFHKEKQIILDELIVKT